MSFQPLHYEVRDVGKHMKSTKKQYIWKFRLDNEEHTVELFTSILSGKKKVIKDRVVLYMGTNYKGAFQFSFIIHTHLAFIIQHGSKFELRIDNQTFSSLLRNEFEKKNIGIEHPYAQNAYTTKDYASSYSKAISPPSRET